MADPDFKPPSSTSQAGDKANKPDQTGVEVERGAAVNPQNFYRNAAQAGLNVIAGPLTGPLLGEAVRSASELFSQANEFPRDNPQQPTPGHETHLSRRDNAELGDNKPPSTSLHEDLIRQAMAPARNMQQSAREINELTYVNPTIPSHSDRSRSPDAEAPLQPEAQTQHGTQYSAQDKTELGDIKAPATPPLSRPSPRSR